MVQKLINLAVLNKMGHIIQEYLDSLISIVKPISHYLIIKVII